MKVDVVKVPPAKAEFDIHITDMTEDEATSLMDALKPATRFSGVAILIRNELWLKGIREST